jgi:dihydroflavonol-4-reductase
VASPFPNTIPKNEDEIIIPAVNGTKFVLEAVVRAGTVKKVVLTSSIAAIFTGQSHTNHFTEKNWSNTAESPPYEKSKHLAEKEAWRIYYKNPDKFELSVINPGYIQGPTFSGSNQFTSSELVVKVLSGNMPGIPRVSIGIVDVRDVALAHVRCIEREFFQISNGKRYILVEGSYWMEEMLRMLRDEF